MFHAILRMYICLSDIKFNWAFYISAGKPGTIGTSGEIAQQSSLPLPKPTSHKAPSRAIHISDGAIPW